MATAHVNGKWHDNGKRRVGPYSPHCAGLSKSPHFPSLVETYSTYSSTKKAAESVGIELSQLSRSLICRPYNKRSPSGFLLCFEDQLGNLGFPINIPVVSSLPSLPSHLALIPRVDLVQDRSPVVPPEAVDEFVILSHRVIGNDVEFLVRYRNSQMWVDMHDVLRQARRSFNNYMAKSFW